MEDSPSTVRRAAPPVAANLLLAALFIGAVVLQTFIVPLFLLPRDPGWGWLLVAVVLATPSYWALAHEAMHGVFHPDKAVNDAAGRLLAVLVGAPFRILRFGHLMHHRFSRTTFDRSEAYDPARRSRPRAVLYHYGRIFGGLYATEVLSCVLALLPRPQAAAAARAIFGGNRDDVPDVGALAERALIDGGNLWENRLDGLAAIALMAAGFILYGEHGWMLLLAILGRGFMISFLDNAPHYGTGFRDPKWSYNLGLPLWVSRLLLHFNMHRVHHRFPNLPWTALPAAFAEDAGGYDGPWLGIVFQQLKGPIPEPVLAAK